MNIVNIQTFLCVVRTQSISLAASQLFISQPAVSSRLRQLEEELGITLINRKKGVRSIELTPQGVKFVALAERWMALQSETENFSQQAFVTPFTVASPDSLNIFLLQPLFRRLTDPDTGLALRVRTQQSPEIFSLIDSMDADAGFAFHLSRSVNVVCKPLFSERMVLLCSSRGSWPDRAIAPSELDPRRELFISWSQDLQQWHDSWWSPSASPQIHLDNASMLPLYMEDPRCWCLCPASVADAFLQQGKPVEERPLLHRPPNRTCYYLTSRTPRSGAAAAAATVFQKLLLEHLASLPPLVQLHPSTAAVLIGGKQESTSV